MDIDRDDEVLNLGASDKQESITTGSNSKYRHKLLKKSLEFFLTVSLLSLLLSFFTGLSYLHSYTYYFSTSFLLPLLDQALQRKYMFLLCNGILVFLAGLSGFRSTAISSSTNIQQGLSEGDDLQEVMMIRDVGDEAIVLQAAAPVEPLYAESTVVSSPFSMIPSIMGVQEKEQLEAQEDKLEVGKDWIKDGGGGLEENEETVNGPIVAGQEGDEIESEGPGSINTEELNRKIDEFIRKMKEELRLEAQQKHLIAV